MTPERKTPGDAGRGSVRGSPRGQRYTSVSVIIRNGQVVRVNQKEQPTRIRVVLDKADSSLADIATGGLDPFATLVLLPPSTDLDRAAYPILSFEPLAEGWWRVM